MSHHMNNDDNGEIHISVKSRYTKQYFLVLGLCVLAGCAVSIFLLSLLPFPWGTLLGVLLGWFIPDLARWTTEKLEERKFRATLPE